MDTQRCFHLLGIVNNAMNTGVQTSVQVPGLHSMEHTPELLDHMVTLCFFDGMLTTTMLFYTAAAPFDMPTRNAQEF